MIKSFDCVYNLFLKSFEACFTFERRARFQNPMMITFRCTFCAQTKLLVIKPKLPVLLLKIKQNFYYGSSKLHHNWGVNPSTMGKSKIFPKFNAVTGIAVGWRSSSKKYKITSYRLADI